MIAVVGYLLVGPRHRGRAIELSLPAVRAARMTPGCVDFAVSPDPLDTVRAAGGPLHTRGHRPAYVERLRATGRSRWADVLLERHADEADPDSPWVHSGGRL